MVYLVNLINSIFSMVFVMFLIGTLGYFLGAISIKGISLGTAGVLVAALAYGIFISYVPAFQVGNKSIVLLDDAITKNFSLVSSIGTAMFVTSVGFIAGPKFFRSFNRSTMSYVYMGMITIGLGALVTVAFVLLDHSLTASKAAGLMTGALTSTPGLAAGKEVAKELASAVSEKMDPDLLASVQAQLSSGNPDAFDLAVATLEASGLDHAAAVDSIRAIEGENQISAGYAIAYLFGVLGVVFFVQLMPRFLKIDIAAERDRFVAANTIHAGTIQRSLEKVDPFGFLPFFLAVAMGCVIGAIKIPGINFSLGNSGGCLIAGLIVGHFGHFGKIDMRIEKSTLNFFRELGLVLFLIGAGVPGGVKFISNVHLIDFVYGALITLIPMVGGYLIGRYVFKLDIFNNLGSITGGMTSTPALGALITTAGTDEVAASYAATYPVALVFVVIAAKVIVLLL